jgi:hypothetical protein
MITPKMRDEFYTDARMYREKAAKHGQQVELHLTFGNPGDAVSHARLAASHARRALELERQIIASLRND